MASELTKRMREKYRAKQIGGGIFDMDADRGMRSAVEANAE